MDALGATTPRTKPSTVVYKQPEEEAREHAYINKDGELYVPSYALRAAIVNASAWYKIGRKSAKQFVAGCVRISPAELVIKDGSWETDRQAVVVVKNKKIANRARVDNWDITFDIIYDERFIPSGDDLYKIVEEAGVRVGLLDYRPQKSGQYGTFSISKWEEYDDA